MKKPKKAKKAKRAVSAAGPRNTMAEEGKPTPLRDYWREIGLGAIVLTWIVVYIFAHPRRAGAWRGAGVIELEGRGGILYANGEPFSIKGINWFGSEAFNGPPGGLHKHSISFYLDFLEQHDFNAIRLLFNHEHVMKDDIVEAPSGAKELFQTRYVEMFGVLAREAAKRGMLVMIACHRINKDAWPGKGLWYDEALGFPETRVMESWSKIAAELCEHWNVFAADLQNEPHASSWGKNPATDWNKAAERIGNHVLGLCPRWLIMVEGVGFTPGAPGADDPGAGYWWGENIVGAKVAPVRLRDQSKLVYSPHVYGPSVYMQHYFETFDFPNNMPAVWKEHFAFAQELGTPIVIGEIGGDCAPVWGSNLY
jgi:endoglucanase